MSRVLIVSGRNDWSAKQVATQLETRRFPYSWLDPADFPTRVGITARLDGGWCGEVETPDGIFSWEEISAVFYRRTRDFDMPSAMSARSGVSRAPKHGLGLRAFDFIVTADTEDHIFLEYNAAGQWGWIAEECGLPIADAIADELTGDIP